MGVGEPEPCYGVFLIVVQCSLSNRVGGLQADKPFSVPHLFSESPLCRETNLKNKLMVTSGERWDGKYGVENWEKQTIVCKIGSRTYC